MSNLPISFSWDEGGNINVTEQSACRLMAQTFDSLSCTQQKYLAWMTLLGREANLTEYL